MPNSKRKLEEYFHERFGVRKSFWKKFKTHERSDSIWIRSKELQLEEKFVATGLRALRIDKIGPKPTTYVLQFLGDSINKNIVKISLEQAKKLISGERIQSKKKNPGYVALKLENQIIGCGLLNSEGLVQNQIPKGRTKELKEVINECRKC